VKDSKKKNLNKYKLIMARTKRTKKRKDIVTAVKNIAANLPKVMLKNLTAADIARENAKLKKKSKGKGRKKKKKNTGKKRYTKDGKEYVVYPIFRSRMVGQDGGFLPLLAPALGLLPKLLGIG